ncbi:hypothetical protein [Acetivibrio straminisolvens]|uniref:Uncharacterized protein n=1 Tax=Acetivibrio straminisolvens JCM 21531 TaxID=1294263 RepID=W4V7Z6_9FIRM|nr:hypothetical protein [Acetivibrio straminisolvens]GAE89500.1 hypothetical protein JCM21531_3033 [Acetivibrio straminisolvens JCM 21531]
MNIYEPKEVKELIADMAIEIQELKREPASVKSSEDMWFRNYQEEKKKYEDLKSKLEAKIADLEKQIAEYEGRKAE